MIFFLQNNNKNVVPSSELGELTIEKTTYWINSSVCATKTVNS